MITQTDFSIAGDALPTCRTDTGYPEFDGFVKAVLSSHFRFSDSGSPSLFISEENGSLLLRAGDECTVLPRPFSAESLLDAAMTLILPRDKFSVDAETSSAVLGGRSVRLTPTELRLFSAILENGNRFSSAEELSNAVWGRIDRNLCAVYISYLRKKLDAAFGEGTLFTVRSKGYRLRVIK